MNVITSMNAYSLYPRATFEDRVAVKLNTPGKHAPSAIDKYRTRGWKIFETIDDKNAEVFNKSFEFDEKRWVGDELTWTIPLPQDGVEQPGESIFRSYMFAPGREDPQANRDCVTINSWSLFKYEGCCSIDFCLFKSPDFRYRYAIYPKKVPFQIEAIMEGWKVNRHKAMDELKSYVFFLAFATLRG